MILAAEPQLVVSDMPRTIAFYRDTLRFEVIFCYGDPPFYAQVGRDGARLNIRLVPGREAARITERDLLAATLTVDDAEPIFHEFQAAGAQFHQLLHSEPWGARTFIVRDPDANLLCFAGPSRT